MIKDFEQDKFTFDHFLCTLALHEIDESNYKLYVDVESMTVSLISDNFPTSIYKSYSVIKHSVLEFVNSLIEDGLYIRFHIFKPSFNTNEKYIVQWTSSYQFACSENKGNLIKSFLGKNKFTDDWTGERLIRKIFDINDLKEVYENIKYIFNFFINHKNLNDMGLFD